MELEMHYLETKIKNTKDQTLELFLKNRLETIKKRYEKAVLGNDPADDIFGGKTEGDVFLKETIPDGLRKAEFLGVFSYDIKVKICLINLDFNLFFISTILPIKT